VKECLEAGLSVQCFEKGADVGGQWIYTPTMTDAAAQDVHSSVYNGVILNSFRDTSAFSDFPYDPARYPAYFSHRLQLGYLNEYAEHFKLREHIRFGTEVLACRPVNRRAGEGGDGNRRVGWTLRVRKVGEGGDGEEVVEELEFDALMVATGAFSKPRLPDLEGQDEFKGEVLHSHYYRTPGPFEDMRVAVVGFGDSAVDIACEVGPQAKELHLITRRGGWVLPRFLFGRPLEAWNGKLCGGFPELSITRLTKQNHKAARHKHGSLRVSPTIFKPKACSSSRESFHPSYNAAIGCLPKTPPSEAISTRKLPRA